MADILQQLRTWFRFQARLGLETYPRTPGLCAFLLSHPRQGTEPLPQGSLSRTPGDLSQEDQPTETPPQTLAETRAFVGECLRCGLHQDRHHIVFGEGPEDARLVLVGEAPGREEDIQGRPFVGPSGELLTKMLRAIHIAREEVYITSAVKCRPPRNRTPRPEEVETCRPFLLHQIRIIRPPLILALGQVAVRTLLGQHGTLREFRGRFHPCRGAELMVTYHPAYLLRFGGERQTALKREAWHDLQMLEKAYARYR